VREQRDGTKRIYEIDPQGLGGLRRWLDRFWDEALDAFKTHLEAGDPTQSTSGRDSR
jgi:DNA-binding PadR family transcriptional regulator